MNLPEEILKILKQASTLDEYFNPHFVVAMLDMLSPEQFGYFTEDELGALYDWAQDLWQR